MKFKYPRIPYDSEIKENERKKEYWKYLSIKNPVDTGIVQYKEYWKKIENEDQADYEAKYMQHSIGHSWSKYSKYGEIFSLRNEHNIPVVTILVSDKKVIHAREDSNARLSNVNQKKLKDFCQKHGYEIIEDILPLDIFIDHSLVSGNTGITYLHRDKNNKKKFMSIVFEGLISKKEISMLLSCLENGKRFNIQDSPFYSLDGHNSEHELSCIYNTDEIPTNDFFIRNMSISDCVASILEKSLKSSPKI